MKLIPQTVYVPVNASKLKVCPNFYVSEFKDKNWHYQSHAEKKENQICLSKEQLTELLGKAFDAGYAPHDHKNPTKEQFINKLLNP